MFGSEISASTANTLAIIIQKCKDGGKHTCKSDAEIDEFIDLYLISLLYSQADYKPEEYDTEPVKFYAVTE